MAIVDILIVAAVGLSVVVGFFRGFVKEAVSVVALIIAAWAAFRFAPAGGNLLESLTGLAVFQSSQAVKLWAGRALVFFAILLLGGLLGWAISYLVNRSGLTGTDRILGMGFGLCRGALLVGVVALAGNYIGFSQDQWWKDGRLVPVAERVGEAIKVLAPQALEYIRQPADTDEDPRSESLPSEGSGSTGNDANSAAF